MSEETDAKSFFENVPSTYGATSAAVMDAPEPKPKVEENPVTPAPVAPAPTDKKPDPAESKGAGFDDLLSKEGDGQPKKTPAQYAEERRRAKAERNAAVEKAPVLEEENRKLKADYEAAQARLRELEALSSKERQEQSITNEDVETLRTRAEMAEKRYIAAHGPDFDPLQDEEVIRQTRLVEDALKANLPKFSVKADGTNARINLDLLRREPERKNAMDTAVAQYAMALNAGDDQGLDKAVMLMGTALGGLDLEENDVRIQIETALSAAAEPFVKGMQRFKHVQENAVNFARQRRAEQIQQTEERLLQPLRFDPAAVDSMLEKEPAHPWANFGKLVNELPDDVREKIEADLSQDALVLGAMRYSPPPLAPNATAQEIAEHEAIVRASNERVTRAAHYLTAGRLIMDGGVLAHLRAQVVEMQERLEELGASATVPRPGGGGGETPKTKSAGAWDAISSSYRKT